MGGSTGCFSQPAPHEQNCTQLGSFRSILFDESERGLDRDVQEQPEFFKDLNLDQVVSSVTAGRDEYNLLPFFYASLSRVEAINYRHDVFRDLENKELLEAVQSFAQQMRAMRGDLSQADKLHYKYQKQSWFLDAVKIYCAAVLRLSHDLGGISMQSRGFLEFRAYLASYTQSSEFTSLASETEKVKTDLSGIRYCLHIQGKRITASRYEGEADYGADVLRTFEKFKRQAANEYCFTFPSEPDMNHVEAAVLDLVAKLYPDIFASLEEHCTRHRAYLDKTIGMFDREIQFYLAWLEHLNRLKKENLAFCYPTVTDRSKEISARDTFDLALANTLAGGKKPVVTNDFFLKDPERILVISGPNQGGKTTFARTFGQLHHLASIGCPVPGSEATLFLFDKLFTHFEQDEDMGHLTSKLEGDLLRLHRIIEQATSRSIIVMNESLLSTTLNDALFLSKEILMQIIRLDILCVSVTFLDELASLSEKTVSMVSGVDPANSALRTFKIVRRSADGLAYAAVIAEKYHLTYESTKSRIAQNTGETLA